MIRSSAFPTDSVSTLQRLHQVFHRPVLPAGRARFRSKQVMGLVLAHFFTQSGHVFGSQLCSHGRPPHCSSIAFLGLCSSLLMLSDLFLGHLKSSLAMSSLMTLFYLVKKKRGGSLPDGFHLFQRPRRSSLKFLPFIGDHKEGIARRSITPILLLDA